MLPWRKSGKPSKNEIRRYLTRVFPYAILYSIEADYILIMAVMHCHREPGYWKNRIRETILLQASNTTQVTSIPTSGINSLNLPHANKKPPRIYPGRFNFALFQKLWRHQITQCR
jgi:hypothetical protein